MHDGFGGGEGRRGYIQEMIGGRLGSFALGIIMQLVGGWTKYTRDDADSRTSVHNPAGYSTLV